MADVKITEITDEKKWHDILFELGEPHFLQSWQWGEHKAAHGWTAQRQAVYRSQKLIGAFSLLTRTVSRWPRITVGYVPRGPSVSDNQQWSAVLEAVETVARRAGCTYVKAEGDLEDQSAAGRAWQAAVRARGWRFSPEQIQPRATAVTDLLPDDPDGEAKLLAGMTKRWRYNVKLGPQRGIITEPVPDNDFSGFYRLFQETGQRQGFSVRSPDYYQEVADRFGRGYKTQAQLFLASHPDDPVPLAATFLIFFGDRVWYFYGASANRHRADMPTYCLQWMTQRWARDHGATIYDWWGAPDDPGNKKDSRYSVWHFKKGFGPRHVLTVGPWDKPLRPALYHTYMSIARYRKRLAKLRHKLPF